MIFGEHSPLNPLSETVGGSTFTGCPLDSIDRHHYYILERGCRGRESLVYAERQRGHEVYSIRCRGCVDSTNKRTSRLIAAGHRDYRPDATFVCSRPFLTLNCSVSRILRIRCCSDGVTRGETGSKGFVLGICTVFRTLQGHGSWYQAFAVDVVTLLTHRPNLVRGHKTGPSVPA